MKRKRYTEEQIISILKEHEAGASAPDLSRRHGVSEQSIYRRKAKFGGMEVSDAKRLRELEAENRKLKRLFGEAELDKAALKELVEQYPKYGCPTLHDMLVIEGEVVNKKRTYRIYCEEGLQVRTKKRKKISRPRVPMLVPDAVNQRWSMDFVSDQLANGKRFRVLNVVDDYSRKMVGQLVSVSISGRQVARFLSQV